MAMAVQVFVALAVGTMIVLFTAGIVYLATVCALDAWKEWRQKGTLATLAISVLATWMSILTLGISVVACLGVVGVVLYGL